MNWVLHILVLISYARSVFCFTISDGNALYTTLLSGYNRHVRPSDNVDIGLKFNLLTINQLDMRTQMLSTSGWFTVTFSDQRLAWNISDYSNIDDTYFHETDIWLPQIVVDNSYDKLASISGANLLIRVLANGLVLWEPPGVYNTHCEVDSTWFPFDKQSCPISISSWAHDMDDINITNTLPYISRDGFHLNGEWIITDSYITSSPKDGRSHLNLVLVMKRRPAFFVMNVIIPILMTSFLTPLVFKLPSEEGERISFILTVVLALEVLLTVVSAHMPATSMNTAVMEVYLVMVLSISAFAVVLTVFVLQLFHKGNDTKIPKIIKIALKLHKGLGRHKQVDDRGNELDKPVDDGVETIQCTPKIVDETTNKSTDNHVINGCNTTPRHASYMTCHEVSKILDELLFWLFLTLTFLCSFIFMLTVSLGGP